MVLLPLAADNAARKPVIHGKCLANPANRPSRLQILLVIAMEDAAPIQLGVKMRSVARSVGYQPVVGASSRLNDHVGIRSTAHSCTGCRRGPSAYPWFPQSSLDLAKTSPLPSTIDQRSTPQGQSRCPKPQDRLLQAFGVPVMVNQLRRSLTQSVGEMILSVPHRFHLGHCLTGSSPMPRGRRTR